MSDLKRVLERAIRGYQPPDGNYDRTLKRVRTRHRTKQIVAGTLAMVVAISGIAVAARQFRTATPVQVSAGPDGLLVFASTGGAKPGSQRDLYAIRPDGTGLARLTRTNEDETGPVISPDGRRIAFLRDLHLYVMNLDGTQERRVSDLVVSRGYAIDESPPAWSPDGRKLAISAAVACRVDETCPPKQHNGEITVIDVASGAATKLTRCPASTCSGDWQPAWSPRGDSIAFVRGDLVPAPQGSATIRGLFVVDVASGSVRQLTHWHAIANRPVWSPDGSSLLAAEGAEGAVLRVDLPSGETREIVAAGQGGFWPVWSLDGARIAFVVVSGTIYGVHGDIFVMIADGTNRHLIASIPGDETALSWGPPPNATPTLVASPPVPSSAAGDTFYPDAMVFLDASHGLVANAEGEIRETLDGGRTWQTKVKLPGAPLFRELATAGSALIALVEPSCDGGPDCPTHVWRSEDGGSTWADLGQDNLMKVAFADATHGWAAITTGPPRWGIASTQDGGRTWTTMANPCPSDSHDVWAVSFPTDRHGWIVCVGFGGMGSAGKAVLETTDGGSTWAVRSAATYGSRPQGTGISESGYPNFVAFDDLGHGFMAMSSGFSLRTGDGGRTWSETSLTDLDLRRPVSLGLAGASMFAIVQEGSTETLMRSNDLGAHWTAVYVWRFG